MTIDLLREAHDRAYAPQAVVALPAPFDGPFLIFDLPARAVTLRGAHVDVEMGVRNVGDDDCFVREITTATGLTLATSADVGRLSYRKRDWVRVPLRIDSFPLSDREGFLSIRFDVQAFRKPEVLTFEAGLGYAQERDDSTAAVVVAEPQLSFTDVADGLRMFGVEAAGAREVLLAIEESPTGRHRYAMRDSGERFQVAVPLVEGRFVYRFIVDGSSRLDDRVLDRTLVPEVGDCSVLDVRKPGALVLHLRNPLDAEVSVEVESQQSWIAGFERRLKIPAGGQADLSVRTDAKDLPAGTHTGQVRLRCRSSRRSNGLVTVPIQLTLSAPSPIPSVVSESTDFGDIHVGSPIERTLKIRNTGSGVLEGRVVTSDGGRIGGPFVIEAGGAPTDVAVGMRGPKEFPSEAKPLQLQFYVETNSLVTGLDRFLVVAQCRLALMEFKPPVVAFGSVTAGMTATHTVAARHGSVIPRTLAVMGTVPNWLRLEFDNLGTITVVVDATRWTGDDAPVKTTLTIKDTSTGLTGPLTIGGEITTPRLVVQPASLNFGTIKRGASKRLSLRLRNEGKGELLVSKLVLDHGWLAVEPEPGTKQQEMELLVRVSAIALKAGRHHGVLELTSNDRSRPKLDIPVVVTVA